MAIYLVSQSASFGTAQPRLRRHLALNPMRCRQVPPSDNGIAFHLAQRRDLGVMHSGPHTSNPVMVAGHFTMQVAKSARTHIWHAM